MKEIPLAGRLGAGMAALVDDDDFNWLSAFRWTANRGGFRQTEEGGPRIGTFYAVRSLITTLRDGTIGRTSREMQSDILYPDERCPKGMKAAHIDWDGLNNQRYNLRLVSDSHSNLKRRLSPTRNTSGYRGISLDKERGWCVTLSAKGRRYHRSGYETRELAAAAYNSLARHLHGDAALMNVLPDGHPQFCDKIVHNLMKREATRPQPI